MDGYIKIVKEEVLDTIQTEDFTDKKVLEIAHANAPVLLKKYNDSGIFVNQIRIDPK